MEPGPDSFSADFPKTVNRCAADHVTGPPAVPLSVHRRTMPLVPQFALPGVVVGPEWEKALEDGFSALLGKPVGDAAGEHAVFHCCPDMSAELFDEGFPARPFAEGVVVGAPFAELPVLGELLAGWDLVAPHWAVDLGGTLFRAGEDSGGGEVGVPELDGRWVSGRELGGLLVERGIDAGELADAYPQVLLRARVDGTLLDALRTATGLHRGPDGLVELSPAHGVAAEWDRALDAVGHAGVRDHLKHLCRTEDSARAHGAHYLGAREPWDAPPHEAVATWRMGEAQSWTAVVRLRG